VAGRGVAGHGEAGRGVARQGKAWQGIIVIKSRMTADGKVMK